MRAHVVYNQVQPELCKEQLTAADVKSCIGIIVNREQPGILMKGRHWFAVVNSSTDSAYYNYDSKLQSPERIGDETALIEWLLIELRDSNGQAFFVAPIESENNSSAAIEQHTPFSDTTAHTASATATDKKSQERTAEAVATACISGKSNSAAAAGCQNERVDSAAGDSNSISTSSLEAHIEAHTTGEQQTESTGTSDRSGLQQATDRIASLALR
jgi:Josephin